MDNLLLAWNEFKRGKTKKPDVQEYQFTLGDNIFQLHEKLKSKTYNHSLYHSFCVRDPKLRHIHRANVEDRVAHQALFRILYQIFNPKFIFDSYSSRLEKGTHAAVYRLEKFARRASLNYQKPVFALKCDIKKFFANIDQTILLTLVIKIINDPDVIWLVEKIIYSFAEASGKGLPLGNVTSQLFSNIYLNELDYFMKHKLRQKYYLRYCDDFLVLHENREYLEKLIEPISEFLKSELKLTLHPDKIIIRKLKQGVDYLGYVTLPHYRVLRTKTKRRALRLVNEKNLASYLGICRHANAYAVEQSLRKKVKNQK